MKKPPRASAKSAKPQHTRPDKSSKKQQNPSHPGSKPAPRFKLSARNATQHRYLREIASNTLCFGLGPAGTGKTFLAVAAAVEAYLANKVEKIILVRPAVEAGERLGFLPGSLQEKVDPYLRPFYDALFEMLDPSRVQKMIEDGIIEVAPLAFMRGRTLKGAFIIMDEAQNTTRAQMKMFLTRLGSGSRAVVTGDLSQIDLPNPAQSGLAEAVRLLKRVSDVGFTEFLEEDVVRHSLVQDIVRVYEEDAHSHRPH